MHINRMKFKAVTLAGLLLTAAQGFSAQPAEPVLWEAQYGWTELHVAARDNNVEAVTRLANRQSVAARCRHRRTPLHIAATFGRIQAAEALIAAGADVHATDQWGTTPLRRVELVQQTRGTNRSALVDLLRRAGAQR